MPGQPTVTHHPSQPCMHRREDAKRERQCRKRCKREVQCKRGSKEKRGKEGRQHRGEREREKERENAFPSSPRVRMAGRCARTRERGQAGGEEDSKRGRRVRRRCLFGPPSPEGMRACMHGARGSADERWVAKQRQEDSSGEERCSGGGEVAGMEGKWCVPACRHRGGRGV